MSTSSSSTHHQQWQSHPQRQCLHPMRHIIIPLLLAPSFTMTTTSSSTAMAFSPCHFVNNNKLLKSNSRLSFLHHPHQQRISISPSRVVVTNKLTNLFAKPPPSAQFDLDAIEAFEAMLMNSLDDDDDDDDVMDDNQNENDSSDDYDDNTVVYTIPASLHNKRLDMALSTLESKISRSIMGQIINDGHVVLLLTDNSNKQEQKPLTRKSIKVEEGQTLHVSYPRDVSIIGDEGLSSAPSEVIPQNIPLDILYEDEYLLVVNKAAGMVVHPAPGNWDGTLANAVRYHVENTMNKTATTTVAADAFITSPNDDDTPSPTTTTTTSHLRPGVVHRLDKGTTGVIIFAKTHSVLSKLSDAFRRRSVRKTYIAITVGHPGHKVVIDKRIGRHPIHRQRMRVIPADRDDDESGGRRRRRQQRRSSSSPQQESTSTAVTGRRALSYVDTLASDGKLSVVQVKIATGRTHQIRVHLQDRRTPIYGDDVYGVAEWNNKIKALERSSSSSSSSSSSERRPMLHAYKLELDHPVTGERMVFVAPLAGDMVRVVDRIWKEGREERGELFGGVGV